MLRSTLAHTRTPSANTQASLRRTHAHVLGGCCVCVCAHIFMFSFDKYTYTKTVIAHAPKERLQIACENSQESNTRVTAKYPLKKIK